MFASMLLFVWGRSGAHTACFEGCHSLFDSAPADAADLFEVAAVLVESSFEMGTTGCVCFVKAMVMLVGLIL